MHGAAIPQVRPAGKSLAIVERRALPAAGSLGVYPDARALFRRVAASAWPRRALAAESTIYPGMSAEPKPEWIVQIEREHAHLRTLLSTLEGKIGEGTLVTGAWIASVTDTLDAILPLLEQHFAREEAALAPDAAVAVFPKLAQKLGVLNQHHPRLIGAFREARAACADRELDAAEAAEVTRRLRATITAMQEHERAETELFALVELPE